jgi:hypothetical protein
MSVSKSEKLLAKERKHLLKRVEYDDALGLKLIHHMSKGLSFETFNVNGVFIPKTTLYRWIKKHPEFAEAKEMGNAASQYRLECIANESLDENEPFKNFPLWYATMKNKHGWADKVDTTQQLSGTLNHTSLVDYLSGRDCELLESIEDDEEDDNSE